MLLRSPQNKLYGLEVGIVCIIDEVFAFLVNSVIEDGIKAFVWENHSIKGQS
jgi:hypothetical protein